MAEQMTPPEWVKVGAKVGLSHGGYSRGYSTATVEKITATQIVTNLCRFSIASLREVGGKATLCAPSNPYYVAWMANELARHAGFAIERRLISERIDPLSRIGQARALLDKLEKDVRALPGEA